MIIREFNIESIAVCETEANPPLVIDPDGKLPFSLPLQFVKSVAWRHLQIFKPSCQIHVLDFADRPSGDFTGKSLRFSLKVQVSSVSIREGPDHNEYCNLSRDKCQYLTSMFRFRAISPDRGSDPGHPQASSAAGPAISQILAHAAGEM